MSSAPAISNDNGRPGERRGFPREMLTHYVVLAFFGEDNWGKLTNLSESGMAIEFARPPSLRERANFTLQVMGCMAVRREGTGMKPSACSVKFARSRRDGGLANFTLQV